MNESDRHIVDSGRDRRLPQRTAAIVAGAAAAVAVAVLVPVALRPGDDGSTEGRLADERRLPRDRPVTTAPYDAPSCPDRLRLTDEVPDVRSATSARICVDREKVTAAGMPPEAGRIPPTPDALVTGFDELATALEALTAPDEDRCATVDVFSTGVLTVWNADGTAASVRIGSCLTLRTAWGAVDGGEVETAYLTALDEQRDRFRYGRDVTTPGCEVGSVPLVRPVRDVLVEAVRCDPVDGPRDELVGELDADAVRRLQEAWSEARRHPDGAMDEEDDCTELEEPPAYVVAVSGRGDLLRIFESPCGYLVLDSWRPGEQWELPVTLADLE